YLKTHDLPAAVQSFRSSIEILETQLGRLGGAEDVKAAYGADQGDIYRDAVAALVERGDNDGAFAMPERARARLLPKMLAERDLVCSAEIPAELDQQRRRLDREYDKIQTELAGGDDPQAVEAGLARMRELRNEQSALTQRIRAASPHLASLQYPQPLDRPGVQAVLDPGTVLLSYSVGREDTLLFALAADADKPLAVFHVAIGRSGLGARVKSLPERVQDPFTRAAQVSGPARELYQLLVQPAEPLLQGAARVLICPDGPLQTLPWAVLTRGSRYLVEWKPLHVIVSGTVYAEVRKARPSGAATGPAVAFGDPQYPRLPKGSAE